MKHSTFTKWLQRAATALFAVCLGVLAPMGARAVAEDAPAPNKLHIPIGTINARDALKSFVESDGSFSPGMMSFGVSQALKVGDTVFQPSDCRLSLVEDALIPRITWEANDIQVENTCAQVDVPVPENVAELDRTRYAPAKRLDSVPVFAWKVRITNRSEKNQKCHFLVTMQNKGPAGGHNAGQRYRWPITLDAFPLESTVGRDRIYLAYGMMTDTDPAENTTGEADKTLPLAEVLAYALPELKPGQEVTLHFVFPVHAGEFINPHRWELAQDENKSENVLLDQNPPVAPKGAEPLETQQYVPDLEVEFYQKLNVDELIAKSVEYWKANRGTVKLETPNPLWNRGFRVMLEHTALCLNDGAPDVAVVNYNTFNRDGMYDANMLQKAGLTNWSARIVDYFLAHPFSGRPYPEADNPGQVLWTCGQQWAFSRDAAWLKTVYPKLRQIANLIVYCRTTPTPHWVNMDSLRFGEDLPETQRQELVPGCCDGSEPEYTEAFDVAGLRAAAALAQALLDAGTASVTALNGQPVSVREDQRLWSEMAKKLMVDYDQTYGQKLPDKYGSYSVLWPCRLYPLDDPKCLAQFGSIGAVEPCYWRYFAPATAHQSLLTGNREAGWKTLESHLTHPQMKDWFAFDEGGYSGGIHTWNRFDSDWALNKNVNEFQAMPHTWAIAEVWHLIRDSICFENGDTLVLFAGIPEAWFSDPAGVTVESFPTYFGTYTFRLTPGQLRVRGPKVNLQLKAPEGTNVEIIWE